MSAPPLPAAVRLVKIVCLVLAVIIVAGVISLLMQFRHRQASVAMVPPPAGAVANGAPVGVHPGKALVGGSDCLACHAVDGKLIGPSFKEIAGRYDETPEVIKTLATKIKTGGAGVWGTIPMTPHPALSDADLATMVGYVFASAKGPAGPVDLAAVVEASGIKAVYTTDEVSRPVTIESAWASVPVAEFKLQAQPLTTPRPKVTTTPLLKVQARHDGQWLALRLQWADPEPSVTRILGSFSDAAAVQFPAKRSDAPPPIAMGSADQPVHVFHWRTEYQEDKEKGFHQMTDIYPNMSVDIYPLEYGPDGNIPRISAQEKEMFNASQAAANPQAFRKSQGVDEILAAGFGTSSVVERIQAQAHGAWANGQWTLVLTRPLRSQNGSVLAPGDQTFLAFAIWQGGQQEVGARKSLTLKWLPLALDTVPALSQK